MRDRLNRRALIWTGIVLAGAGSWAQERSQPDPDRWETAIRAFEESDRADPPPPGGVVFLGSSSFRRWHLERSFPGKELVNRGFGGSQMADAIRYLDRIVLPLKPRTLFLYEGDNDLANGKAPETVEVEFRDLVSRVHAALPETKIVFISIKPSIRRWHLIDSVRDANVRIRAVTETSDLLEFVDVVAPMLGASGEPRRDLFVEDDLHLTEAGYKIWAALVEPYLD